VSPTASPFRDALDVGVGGINFYARDAAEVVHTVDLDVLLRRSVERDGHEAQRGALSHTTRTGPTR
jgi:hypothetical protein